MRRYWLAVAAATLLSACGGGNPWLDTGSGGGGTTPTIPAALIGDLESFTYDPVAQTLVVRGISQDASPAAAVYTRKAALDVPGYEAYTAQSSATTPHATAYVQERDGVIAGIIVTGGQSGNYFGGSSYYRAGAYTPPTGTATTQIVTYTGTYVGLLNLAGDGGDLLPVAPGTPNSERPFQAAEVTGNATIIADFADNVVSGVINNRVVVDQPTIDLSAQNIELAPTAILTDGTFEGSAEQSNVAKGTYGGIFGGVDSSAVGGTLFVDNHIDGITNIEEYGVFVLGR
ncbi:MAG: thymidylate synthase [Rhodobacteraceae bacterium]|nr:MAG: thymidylate synthase [Paracoccaceae bacterium]